MPTNEVLQAIQAPFSTGHAEDVDEFRCGAEWKGLQWRIDYYKNYPYPPKPTWATGITDILRYLDQAAMTALITPEGLAQQVFADAAKNLLDAATKFSSALTATTVVASAHEGIADEEEWFRYCGLGYLQLWLKEHFPKPHRAGEIADLLHGVNQALVTRFITNPHLAQQARVEAAKTLLAAAKKFSAPMTTQTVVAA